MTITPDQQPNAEVDSYFRASEAVRVDESTLTFVAQGSKLGLPSKRRVGSNRQTVRLPVVLSTILITSALAFGACAFNGQLVSGKIAFISQTSVTQQKRDSLTLQKAVKLRSDLMQAKATFSAGLPAVEAAINSASGKVDITASLTVINAAKAAVLAEQANPANIPSQLAVVTAEANKINVQVAAYVADLAAKEAARQAAAKQAAVLAAARKAPTSSRTTSATSPSGSTKQSQPQVSFSSTNTSGTMAEQAMDDITGNTVNVVIGTCVAGRASDPASCVRSDNPNTVIVVAKYVQDPSFGYTSWYQLMMHELGHVVQFSHYAAFSNSQGFKVTFGGDIELYADCMARQRIGASYRSGYGFTCTPEQLAVGAEAWKYNFV